MPVPIYLVQFRIIFGRAVQYYNFLAFCSVKNSIAKHYGFHCIGNPVVGSWQLVVGEDQKLILRLGFSGIGKFIHLIPCHYRFIYFTSIDLFLILFSLTLYERIPLGKTISYIFVCLFFLSSVLPCSLYSQCCKGEESTLTFPPDLVGGAGTLTGNSEAEDDCKGDCSPVMHCGDCLAWFITMEILKPSKSLDQKNFYTSYLNGTVIRIPQEIFRPPKI